MTRSPAWPRSADEFAGYASSPRPRRTPISDRSVAELGAHLRRPRALAQGRGRRLSWRPTLERLATLPYDEVVLWTFAENAPARSPSTSATAGAATAPRRSMRARGSPQSGSGDPSQWTRNDGHLRREALADPALRAGHLARRGQGQGGDPRRGQARVERVALPAAPGRDRGDHPRGRGGEPLSRTRTRGPCAARSRTTTRPTRPGSPSRTAPARSCSPPPWRSASPATRSSTPGPPSRSIRTCRRSPAPARSGCRSPRATSTTSTRCSRRSRPPRSC